VEENFTNGEPVLSSIKNTLSITDSSGVDEARITNPINKHRSNNSLLLFSG
jgi:hypothetical protein